MCRGLFVLENRVSKAFVTYPKKLSKGHPLTKWHQAFSHVNTRDVLKTFQHIKDMQVTMKTVDHCLLCKLEKSTQVSMYLLKDKLKLYEVLEVDL